jgi:hypothetical protein
MKSLVASVNCLVSSAAEKTKSVHTDLLKTGFLVDSFPIVGPRHTHSYPKIVLAMVSVPAGNEIKTAVVTPDAPEGSVTATMGAECKIKINPDSTVESHLRQLTLPARDHATAVSCQTCTRCCIYEVLS